MEVFLSISQVSETVEAFADLIIGVELVDIVHAFERVNVNSGIRL